MFDVFVSHSSEDKVDIVAPLVDLLTKKGLQVWYDNNNIIKGDIIKESILSGINESVIFVAVITNNFFKSNWASLELGILQSRTPNNFIPLMSTDVKEFASQRYPFIFDHNYIELSSPLQKTADELYNVVTKIKHEQGLWHINKTNLKYLIREMRQYNDFKLDQLAIHLNSLIKKMSTTISSPLIELKFFIEAILKDVALHENVYLARDISITNLFIETDIVSDNLREHIKYLKQFYSEEQYNIGKDAHLSQTELYLVQFSIYSITEWYMLSYFKKPTLTAKTIVAVSPEEFTNDDIFQSHVIEKMVLPPNLIADPSVVILWNEHNPLTFIGARDATNGKLIGFFNTLPISDTLYDEILSGNFDDTQLSINDIRQYDMPGFYKLYLCSFCIHPAYNTSSAFKVIYNSFIDFLLQLAKEREIFISDIIADGVTPKGINLCESIGMSKVNNSMHNSSIYNATLIPPEHTTLRLNNIIGRRLISYYERIYNQYRDLY